MTVVAVVLVVTVVAVVLVVTVVAVVLVVTVVAVVLVVTVVAVVLVVAVVAVVFVVMVVAVVLAVTIVAVVLVVTVEAVVTVVSGVTVVGGATAFDVDKVAVVGGGTVVSDVDDATAAELDGCGMVESVAPPNVVSEPAGVVLSASSCVTFSGLLVPSAVVLCVVKSPPEPRREVVPGDIVVGSPDPSCSVAP